MKKTALLFSLLLVTATLFAQKPFEGYIKYTYKVLGEGAENLTSMMPTSMEVFTSKKASTVRMNGGMFASMMGDIISTSKETYLVKKEDKTYSVIATPAEKVEDKTQVIKEDEVITIQGLSCQKYKVIKPTEQGEMTTYVWLATDYKMPVTGGKGTETMAVPGVPGIAMKTMVSQMGFTVVVTAVEFKKGKQDKSLFVVPKGFTKKDFDAGMFGM